MKIDLSATVKPENASNRTVVWSVTGGDGAKVDEKTTNLF